MFVELARRMFRLRRRLWAALPAALIAALVTATAPALAAETTHIVQPGDNLSRIAQRYGVEPAQLAAVNGITNPNRVLIGQRLIIPTADTAAFAPASAATTADAPLPGAGGYHVVAPGDSLSVIARRYGMSMDDLMRLNRIANPNTIYVGQQLRLSARVAATAAPVRNDPVPAGSIYVVQPGDSLSKIAQAHNTTVDQLMRANGLPNAEFVYSGQRLRIQTPAQSVAAASVRAPADGERWILVTLSNQTLTAYQGNVPVMHSIIASGKPGTPTKVGEFRVYAKVPLQRMTGPGWDIPNVPWILYYDGDYAIHGAYWHANFGTPTSRGCVNMTVEEARILYEWASVGTRVVIQY